LEEGAVKANELLLWLSARREGSWQQFRGAVEELHSSDGDNLPNHISAQDDGEFPLNQRLRLDLERLAHVEFFAGGCENGWRVVPPTLAAQPGTDSIRAVLCGARSPALRDRLIRAAGKFNFETLNPSGAPDVLRFVASDLTVLADLARRAGLYLQPDAPLAILSHLPPCDASPHELRRAEFPTGRDWSIYKFETSHLAWSTKNRHDAETARFGLFCFKDRFQHRHYFLRWAGETFAPRNHRAAAYVMLKRNRQRVLQYESRVRSLTLPAKCHPPMLLERALVLCSGLPPAYDSATSTLTYADVPVEIARFAAELLRQPFR